MGDTKGDTKGNINGESLFDTIKNKLSNILQTAQDNNQKLNTNNSGMDDIVQRITALQGRLDAIKNRISELSSRVSTEQLNELSLQIDDIQGAISSQNVDDRKISALNDAITNLETKVQEIEDAFNNNGGPAAQGPRETKAPLTQGNISNPSKLDPESKVWDPDTNTLRGGKRKRRRKRKSKKTRRKRKSKKKGGYKFDAVAIKSRKSRLQTRKLNSRKRKRTKKKRRRRRRRR